MMKMKKMMKMMKKERKKTNCLKAKLKTKLKADRQFWLAENCRTAMVKAIKRRGHKTKERTVKK